MEALGKLIAILIALGMSVSFGTKEGPVYVEEAVPAVEEEEAAEEAEEVEPAEAAYDPDVCFTATDLITGETIDETIFSQYDITVVNCWEPWCGPCVNEMPYLEELSRVFVEDSAGFKVNFIGVYSSDDGAEDVVDELGITYNIIKCDELTNCIVGNYVPSTAFVDSEGHFVYIDSADEQGFVLVGSRDFDTWMTLIEEAYACSFDG